MAFAYAGQEFDISDVMNIALEEYEINKLNLNSLIEGFNKKPKLPRLPEKKLNIHVGNKIPFIIETSE